MNRSRMIKIQSWTSQSMNFSYKTPRGDINIILLNKLQENEQLRRTRENGVGIDF